MMSPDRLPSVTMADTWFLIRLLNLVASDTNGKNDVFLRDRPADTTEIVSVNSGGTKVNGDSFNPTLSSNAQYVVYSSLANNLISGFGNSNGATYASQTGVTNDY